MNLIVHYLYNIDEKQQQQQCYSIIKSINIRKSDIGERQCLRWIKR